MAAMPSAGAARIKQEHQQQQQEDHHDGNGCMEGGGGEEDGDPDPSDPVPPTANTTSSPLAPHQLPGSARASELSPFADVLQGTQIFLK
jgi:hypothetical protein